MTEIEKKALALENDIRVNQGHPPKDLFIRTFNPTTQALCRAIEQHEADKAAHAATIEGILNSHEAYKQEVSDVVSVAIPAIETWVGNDLCVGKRAADPLRRFIIPKPTVDPLVEAVGEAMQQHELYSKYELADSLRIILTKRGLKIVEIER